MNFNFGGDVWSADSFMRIEAQQTITSFILIPWPNKDREIEKDVELIWLNWRTAFGVLCDLCIPTRLNGNFYRTPIRPTMIYGAGCWPIKKQYMHKMSGVKIRMLWWMCGKTKKDEIRNERFREHFGVTSIGDKERLFWDGLDMSNVGQQRCHWGKCFYAGWCGGKRVCRRGHRWKYEG